MLGTKSIKVLSLSVFIFFVLFACLFYHIPVYAKTNLEKIAFNLPSNSLQRPTAAARSSDGKTYVCDAAKQYIAVFDAQNTPLFTFNENLSLPIDIALSNSHIFVLDETSHSILLYDYDGNYIKTLGAQGISAGLFYEPSAMLIDGTTLYVADTGNNRIQLFDTDTFDLLDIFAVEENGTDLTSPTALAISGDTLFVVEAGGTVINTYDKSSGKPLDIALSRSAERNIDISLVDGLIALSSPASKQIIFYDLNLVFQA